MLNYSEAPVLFANVPVGSWFRKVGTHSAYLKVDGWRAQRKGSTQAVRVPAVTVCYVATER